MSKLLPCKACGKTISRNANPCPLCGEPNPTKRASVSSKFIWAFLAIAVLLPIITGITANLTKDGGQGTTKTTEQLVAKARENRKRIREQIEAELAGEGRDAIIRDIKQLLAKQDFKAAAEKAARYSQAKDKEIAALHERAKEGLKRDEEQRILALLKSIPASNHEANINYYTQLNQLYPTNQLYKQKLDTYQKQLAAKKARDKQARQDRVAKFGNPPVASGWDGSYRPVVQYLKRALRDPGSLEMESCTQVYHTKNGWLVGCNYRARNGFGGMNTEGKWFTIRNDLVVNVQESSAYNP